MGCGGGVGNNVSWHLRIDVMLCQGWGGLGWVTFQDALCYVVSFFSCNFQDTLDATLQHLPQDALDATMFFCKSK